MKKNFVHSIAIVLLLVFLLPSILKTVDALFHTHKHTVCNSKNTQHYHIKGTDCIIIGLQSSTFLAKLSLIKSLKKIVKISFYSNLYIPFKKIHLNKTFLLRAPPFLIS